MSGKIPSKLLKPGWGCSQTDSKAWSTIERCMAGHRLQEIPLPIPVEEWIENPLGVRFGYSDLSYLGPGVLGATFLSSNEILIDEKAPAHEGRCRFTCAHELGHMILHRRVRDKFYDTHADARFTLDKCERQADRFAAAFLMPLPALEKELLHALDQKGLARADCVNELLHVTAESEWLWRYRVLPRLTKAFDVSVSAAVFRCADIQLRLRNPRRLLPRQLIRRLLARTRPDDTVMAVQVVDGRPTYRDLFTPGTGVSNAR